MIEVAKLIDKANRLGADISIWSSRQTKSWQVRVSNNEIGLRVINEGRTLDAACSACLADLENDDA